MLPNLSEMWINELYEKEVAQIQLLTKEYNFQTNKESKYCAHIDRMRQMRNEIINVIEKYQSLEPI